MERPSPINFTLPTASPALAVPARDLASAAGLPSPGGSLPAGLTGGRGRAIRWMRAGADVVARRRERRLIDAAQRGSRDAFGTLFRLHWPGAHRAAFLIVRDAAAAEDIAQEAFLAAIRNLDRFDRRRPFAPWIHRIVTNRAIDWARARRLRAEAQLDPVGSGHDLADAQPDALEAPRRSSEVSDELLDALGELSIEHRAVIVLRYLLDYTPGEIAEALEIPRGTVNSRLRRALDKLSALYEAADDVEAVR